MRNGLVLVTSGKQRLEVGAQARHGGRELIGAGRRLAQPEGNGRRLAFRILDAHPAGFDAQDAIRSIAELEDVAGEAFDREVLIERAHEDAGRLENDLVVRVVRDGATAGDGRESRPLAGPQHLVDRVAMQVRAASSALGTDTFGQHAHHGVEIRAREIAVRICAPNQCEQLVLAVFARGYFGHDLLREYVEWMLRDVQAVELTAPHGVEQRHAIHQLIAAARKDASLRHAADRVVGATDALQEYGNRTRRAQLAHQFDVADVDAQLQRRGGHHDLE